MGGAQDISKAELFRELGFAPSAELEHALAEAGLSNPRKPRISLDKREAVRALLEGAFFRVCARGDCQFKAQTLAGERRVALASGQDRCEVCGGSVNQRAIDAMIEACRSAGWSRVCVVGGSPSSRRDLDSGVGKRLELRLIDGTKTRNLKSAAADTEWADCVVLWGGTQLDHKVSNLYRGDHVVTATARGVPEVAATVEQAAKRAASRTGRRPDR
ncbi:MAG: hypothetical protein IT439_06965 [Phycisphaerales bacterium]|nr:hypothetical protein [Phycisphaerales bacterium]